MRIFGRRMADFGSTLVDAFVRDNRVLPPVLAVLALTGTVEIWHVYVLALVLGTAAAFDAPARQSFVSEIVEPDEGRITGRLGADQPAGIGKGDHEAQPVDEAP